SVSSSIPETIAVHPRRVVVLGSTGSIGTNCLDVMESLPDRLTPLGLSAHARWELLFEQAERWRPRWITLTDPDCFSSVDRARLNRTTQLLFGQDGVTRMVTDPDVDVVVTAI